MLNKEFGCCPNHRILCVKGPTAQSQFKDHQLLVKISSVLPELKSIRAEYCFFISIESSLSESELEDLANLIEGDANVPIDLFSTNSILAAPRIGTVSAWSTKATEISLRCGFDSVNRIERATLWTFESNSTLDAMQIEQLYPFVYDRMTESIIRTSREIELLFEQSTPLPIETINISGYGINALREANNELGLALSSAEIEFLFDWYEKEGRDPTDAEVMMFSQVNSEHGRHKIFNASWEIGEKTFSKSMFSMIQETHKQHPEGTLVAYHDNATVIEGSSISNFAIRHKDRKYEYNERATHIVFKAETHNHPTAISPFPGAATGAGGEIRDEGATGTGGAPKAGLCGFSVSHLRVPNFRQPWEEPHRAPNRIATPLQIMLDAPIGAASFNNEFGRPNIGGYFRTFETSNLNRNSWYGFHKPIMFAGGLGNIRSDQISKKPLKDGDLLIVIGGPSMLIGLGGGAASSLDQGTSGEELDYASVQRSNPEMQRRAQEVIYRCVELGQDNPILSIHDVGAGGLSNALPEIVHASGCGAFIDLRKIPNDDFGMSPMQIWCNESQERYVLSISPSDLERFEKICHREHCPFAVVGKVTAAQKNRLIVDDDQPWITNHPYPVDVDMEFLLCGFLKTKRSDISIQPSIDATGLESLNFDNSAECVLRFPSVADKSFLVTIGDRSVTGLIHRDQMVGPWQVPVADAAITLAGYESVSGEAMAIGERSPIAVSNAPASARMAVGEALTNLRSAAVSKISDVKLCANWMAAPSIEGEGSQLYESVRTVALDICTKIGLSIPVGKDSLSMLTKWGDYDGRVNQVQAPMSLVATAFSSIKDVRRSVTPQLLPDYDTELVLIDLGGGQNRMGMSVLYQTHNFTGGLVPDLDDPYRLKTFFDVIGELLREGQILAYHDRSDGGLFATLCEMAFAGRTGLDIFVPDGVDSIQYFFNEELGAVIQVKKGELPKIEEKFKSAGIFELIQPIGTPITGDKIKITVGKELVFKRSRIELHRIWSELTWRLQSIRDNPECAKQEYDRILVTDDPGLEAASEQAFRKVQQMFSSDSSKDKIFRNGILSKPSVAILREQGVNGHVEMAAAFERAGFDCFDVMMSDLLNDEASLNQFQGIVLCGGFSFGDVLGAGRGWAGTILHSHRLKDIFEEYFADAEKFALAVCNGCQVMAELASIIPGTATWPKFRRNSSEQFEARLLMVEVTKSQSILMKGLENLHLPIAVSHGEGKACFQQVDDIKKLQTKNQIVMQYVDNFGNTTSLYPFNPNGSDGSIAGVTNLDGRITAMMPHPERVVRTDQLSCSSDSWGPNTPWLEMFRNAKRWLN